MSAIFEAHLRMIATLPVRTHEQKAVDYAGLEDRDVYQYQHQQRRQRIRELIAQGVSKRQIHKLIGISRTAVQKHLRAIKRGK